MEATETNVTLPERCPVCGAECVWTPQPGEFGGIESRTFLCRAVWVQVVEGAKPRWFVGCPHAMPDATLEPPPRELARDALVAACRAESDAYSKWDAAMEDDDVTAEMLEPLTAACGVATRARQAAWAAYADTEPQP